MSTIKRIVTLIGAIAVITLGYARGADPISCDGQITWVETIDMRLARQHFDERRKLWIALYQAVDGRQCEVPQTFAEAMRTEWTSTREWMH
jgi:hypothetical protein